MMLSYEMLFKNVMKSEKIPNRRGFFKISKAQTLGTLMRCNLT